MKILEQLCLRECHQQRSLYASFLPDLSKLFNKENRMSFRELSFEISKKFLDEIYLKIKFKILLNHV